ncbi:hypothetical protein [Sphingobium sp. BHU LFT2]|uniref:hypothetical protein n=1 Tax=Sphingobium sp. BHU LFT2 TaxID=2807634 RepID=UPI002035B5FD|nr:hypothetical protein [Sphingobium sp. BHU LFT2]
MIRKAIGVVATAAICSALAPAPAKASDYGCQVLLCLSNPGGATQYSQCVPPITKLWRQLATGKAFPTCTGAGVVRAVLKNKNNSARRRVDMTYADGTMVSYSLAGIEYAAVSQGAAQ